ncbi:MAG: hypothetical protein V3U78_01240 [Thiotrichaceae bacterium]
MNMKLPNKSSNIITFFLMIASMASSYADTATATQHLRVIIPQVALIDTENTHIPLTMTFTPMTEAGNNFPVATATGLYDVSSNINKLRLYGKINQNLESNYNLILKVNATGSTYKELTTSTKRIITIGKRIKTDKTFNYEASVALANKTVPYGDIDVIITYTLVEP